MYTVGTIFIRILADANESSPIILDVATDLPPDIAFVCLQQASITCQREAQSSSSHESPDGFESNSGKNGKPNPMSTEPNGKRGKVINFPNKQ